MKSIGIQLDDETIKQIRDLAELWGLPTVRHNTPVIARCVERVWLEEIGLKRQAEEEGLKVIDKVR